MGIQRATTIALAGKVQRICEAQGGMRKPPVSKHRQLIVTDHAGRIVAVDNRRPSKVAKLAGAPDSKTAWVELYAALGDEVDRNRPIYAVHAETPGQLGYALAYSIANGDIHRVAAP